ncbi:hypothetical protein [Niabella drilacis]|nr:hypothetical protein [Niabella drilacis]
MRKFAHILALLILLIGSSFDTLELLVPAQKTGASAEKNQQGKSSQRELVNDELIISRSAHQLSVTAARQSLKQHPLYLPPGALLRQLPPPVTSMAKQQPGYGTLFRYYLF